MSDLLRIRRPIPERTAPMRDVSGAWRTTEAPPVGATSEPAPRPVETSAEVAERSVALAYRVLDEHLRRGRDAARRWSAPTVEAASPGGRAPGANLWADAAHALFDVMAAVTRGAGHGEPPVHTPPPTRHAAATPSPPPDLPTTPVARTAPAVAVVLHAGVPVEVELDLRVLPAHGLIAGDLLPLGDPSRPSLTSASVERVGDGVRVRLRVPADQPPDEYTGTVHDAGSGAACGVLRVVVHG